MALKCDNRSLGAKDHGTSKCLEWALERTGIMQLLWARGMDFKKGECGEVRGNRDCGSTLANMCMFIAPAGGDLLRLACGCLQSQGRGSTPASMCMFTEPGEGICYG